MLNRLLLVLLAIASLVVPLSASATDLTVTAANVSAASGSSLKDGTAGATITAGQAIYLDTTDKKLKLADANGAGDSPNLLGIALNGASNGQPLKYIENGKLNPGATVVVGTIYVLSATAGGIAPAADLAAGHKVSILAIGTAANELTLVIKNSGVAVPGA